MTNPMSSDFMVDSFFNSKASSNFLCISPCG